MRPGLWQAARGCYPVAMGDGDFPLDADGIWLAAPRSAPAAPPGRPALFLDRDGLLVEEVNYLHRPEDLRLLPGAAPLLAAAAAAGWARVLVTNQSGIGRGYYGWADFAATEAELERLLAAGGGGLDLVVACPFHGEALPPYDRADHPDRKPAPGMLLKAAARLGLDRARSWILGDQASDIAAGRAAGLAGGVLVLEGHALRPGEREKALAEATEAYRVVAVAGLLEAASLLWPAGRKQV